MATVTVDAILETIRTGGGSLTAASEGGAASASPLIHAPAAGGADCTAAARFLTGF